MMISFESSIRQGVPRIAEEIAGVSLAKGVDVPLWYPTRCDTDTPAMVWHRRTNCNYRSRICSSTGPEMPQDTIRGGAQTSAVKGLSRHPRELQCCSAQGSHC